jgi:hypothetical protein
MESSKVLLITTTTLQKSAEKYRIFTEREPLYSSHKSMTLKRETFYKVFLYLISYVFEGKVFRNKLRD